MKAARALPGPRVKASFLLLLLEPEQQSIGSEALPVLQDCSWGTRTPPSLVSPHPYLRGLYSVVAGPMGQGGAQVPFHGGPSQVKPLFL